MARTFHASRDTRRTERVAHRQRVDLAAMAPFMAQWREDLAAYPAAELDRIVRQSRERAAQRRAR